MKLPLRIAVVAVLLVLALIGLVVREGVARGEGQEAVLQINAYDPRSPLSGHYAAFQIQEPLPAGAPCPPGVTADGALSRARSPVGWIALKRDGERYRVAGAAMDRGQAAILGDLAVRGRAYCSRSFVAGEPAEGLTVTLSIGVDRFHADQKQAEAIAGALRQGSATPAFVVVSVGRDGKARLKGIVVNGRRTDLTWL